MSWCLGRPDQPTCNVGEIQIFVRQKDKFQVNCFWTDVLVHKILISTEKEIACGLTLNVWVWDPIQNNIRNHSMMQNSYFLNFLTLFWYIFCFKQFCCCSSQFSSSLLSEYQNFVQKLLVLITFFISELWFNTAIKSIFHWNW